MLFDAGVFICALLTGDSRHAEARPLVEAARRGDILACTTTGILGEIYAVLTWHQAQPPPDPEQAAEAVRLLVELPLQIRILPDNWDVTLRMLEFTLFLSNRRGRPEGVDVNVVAPTATPQD